MTSACLAFILALASCRGSLSWTKNELALIQGKEDVMRVLAINSKADSIVLRCTSTDLLAEDIASPVYRQLERKMVATVTSPEQDGVGIAGPQVGILRRVVAVMRYDKQGQPFEVYPNIRIVAFYGDRKPGPEGCLSVPDMRADVNRYQSIDIAYTNPKSLQDTTEHVEGFTAVIFQHECDHLDGVLYIDRVENGILEQALE